MQTIALKTLLVFSITIISSCSSNNKYDENRSENSVEKSGIETDTYINDKDSLRNKNMSGRDTGGKKTGDRLNTLQRDSNRIH
jgi:hypothetical protein